MSNIGMERHEPPTFEYQDRNDADGPSFWWRNPWTGLRECVARLFWPAHPEEATEKVEHLFESLTLSYQPKPLMKWNPMSSVPRVEDQPLLLLSRTNGVVEARWCPGEWSSEIPGVCGREYSGPVWVCGDDQWQIEVEEGPDNYFHDGEAIGWLPRSVLPEQPGT